MSCTKEWVVRGGKGKTERANLIDRLLEVRGITTAEAKKDFLNPLEITLMHPNAFCDMQKAVDRIVKAIDEKENILIYGDFDADGVTSTSVLMKTFSYLGANVDYYIPERENEGHGLHTKALVQLLSQKKPKLIITVDNGISSVEEVKFINSFGRDVIITDHHEAPEVLPEAYAIINPKAMNALDEMLEENDAVLLTGEGVDSFASFYNATVGRGVYLRRVREILEAHPDKELVADKGKELIWELSLSEDGSPENLTGISGLEDSVSADTEAMYLAGTIAGRSTQSGKVGMLVDQNWMAVYEEYFRAGMKASGKETEMYLYGESFSNTDAGRAVQSFADAGCDIIAGYALSQEVCSLAGKLGIATLSLEDCAKTEHYADINLNGFLKLDGIAEKVAECIRGGFAIDSYVDTLSGLAVSSELPEAISSGFSADISELVLQAQEDYDAFCKAYRTNDLSIPAMTKDVALRTLCMPDLPANAFFLPGQIGENYYVPMEADHGTSLENPGEGLYYNISQEEYQKLVNDIKEATGSKGQREQDSDIVNYQLEFAKDGVVFQADVAYMNFAQVVWVNWSVIGHTD